MWRAEKYCLPRPAVDFSSYLCTAVTVSMPVRPLWRLCSFLGPPITTRTQVIASQAVSRAVAGWGWGGGSALAPGRERWQARGRLSVAVLPLRVSRPFASAFSGRLSSTRSKSMLEWITFHKKQIPGRVRCPCILTFPLRWRIFGAATSCARQHCFAQGARARRARWPARAGAEPRRAEV